MVLVTMINGFVVAQDVAIRDPFLDDEPSAVDVNIKRVEQRTSVVVTNASLNHVVAPASGRSWYKKQELGSGSVNAGANIQLQSPSGLLADARGSYSSLGSYGSTTSTTTVVMRGPGGGGPIGGVEDDSVGEWYVLILLMLGYGLFRYRKQALNNPV